jgi:hypothetical protein
MGRFVRTVPFSMSGLNGVALRLRSQTNPEKQTMCILV